MALVEWLDPLFAPGHWVPEQVELAGGTSVIGQAGERSRETTLGGACRDVDQRWSCWACAGSTCRARSTSGQRSRFPTPLARTPAWRDGELWAIDGSAYVSRPGPRLVDGVEILAAILAGRADDRAVRLLATTVP